MTKVVPYLRVGGKINATWINALTRRALVQFNIFKTNLAKSREIDGSFRLSVSTRKILPLYRYVQRLGINLCLILLRLVLARTSQRRRYTSPTIFHYDTWTVLFSLFYAQIMQWKTGICIIMVSVLYWIPLTLYGFQ